jgi:hypothetical protein
VTVAHGLATLSGPVGADREKTLTAAPGHRGVLRENDSTLRTRAPRRT